VPALALDALDHARAEEQLGAGAAGQTVVEERLEPAALVVAVGRAAGDRGRGGIGVEPATVRAEHRRALGPRQHAPANLLAGPQPRQAEMRRPGDSCSIMLVVHRERDRAAERAEVVRGDDDGHGEGPAGRAGELADAHGGGRGGVVGRAVQAAEARPRVGLAAAVVERVPHGALVAARPAAHEALGGVAAHVRLVVAVDDVVGRPAGRGEHEHDHKRGAPGHAVAPAAAPAARFQPGHGRAPRRSRGEHRTAATTTHAPLSTARGGGVRCAYRSGRRCIWYREWVAALL
jgi:hypothetical protein